MKLNTLAKLICFTAAVVLLSKIAIAGDLEPSSVPGSTMYTLDEIYNKIDSDCGVDAPVAKTGQTACYDASGNIISCSGTGQDGEFQKGVSSPSPRFTDNGDGTVTDNLTGLVWLKNANCFGAGNWYDALTACNTLNSGECGLTDDSVEGDWRLPNKRELISITDDSRYNPVLPSGHPFSSVQNTVYWSGTSYAGNTNNAWNVSMPYGEVGKANKFDNPTYYAWPVRGGN